MAANESFRSEILKVFRKGVSSPKAALVLIFGALRVVGLQHRGHLETTPLLLDNYSWFRESAAVSSFVLCFVGSV